MKRCWALFAALLLIACRPIAPIPGTAPQPTSTPPPVDTGWQPASAGIERRELRIRHNDRRDRLFLVRVDPARASFQVVYDSQNPRHVREWLDAEQARLAINGGFFDPQNRALGLLIADGQAFGETYVGLGGLFGVQAGQVQIRSLIRQPYQAGEVFDQMVQSFPTLLVGNGEINREIQEDGGRAMRSVVGIDRAGRVVFLLSPGATFTLTELAGWLAASDLELSAALNLDGGTSSGLIVRLPGDIWGIDSWAEVPAAIVVR